jgi:D-arabinose 1-dehydrogenase-like Zn-dependent alcohol dehydrogenase
MPTTYPLVPGHEFVCEVAEVGSNVTGFKKGEKVGFGTKRACCGTCAVCLSGDDELCSDVKDDLTYGRYFGGYSTQVQQPYDFFFKLPETFKLNLGSPLFCAGITTFYPIQKYYKPGMKCAVVGIGGLGHLAIKFLHKLGAYTAAFTTSEKKIQSIKDLGADEVIVSTKEEEMKKAAGKFDLLLYTVPSVDKFEMYLATVAKKGICVLLGVGENNDIKFNYFPLLKKEIKVVGSLVGPRGAIKNMVDFCNEKDVYPICEEYDFEDLPKAFDKLENGKPHFRCVVNVKDWAKKHGFRK